MAATHPADSTAAAAAPSMAGDATPASSRDRLDPTLALIGGLVIGGLLAAAWGLDLWPREPALRRTIEILRDENLGLVARVRDLEAEVAALRGGGGKRSTAGEGRPKTSSAADAERLPTPGEALDRLERRDWSGFAGEMRALLIAGESGRAAIHEILRVGVENGLFDAFAEGAAIFPVLRLAVEEEDRIADFIAASLGSAEWRRGRELEDWFLRWSSWFLAGSGESNGAARAALHQSLDRRLRSGDTDVWAVIFGLDLLEGSLPADSVRWILEEPGLEEAHGVILKKLEARGDASAVAIIERCVAAWPAGDWKRTLAIESLGRIQRAEADAALARLLAAEDAATRAAAQLAYFSRPREVAAALALLMPFLDSGATLPRKRLVLGRVVDVQPEIFAALAERAGELKDAALKAEIESIRRADAAARPVPAGFSQER